MKAVVMAGGEGTRLRPLTCRCPKPLINVVNKPVMQHIVELLKRHNTTQIVSTLHYLADEIVGYFGDGSDFGVEMSYSVEDTPLGTAGSVKNAEHLLGDETFAIISGDALTDIDITAAYEFHKSRGAVATLVLKHVPNPLEYGVVVTDEGGAVQRFLEKPSWGEVFSDTVNTGIYILEPEVFGLMEPGKNYDFSQDIFPQLLKNGRPIFGFVSDGYWCDIGNLDACLQANHDALEGKVNVQIPGRCIGDGIWVGTNAEISSDARVLGPTLLGNNCRIKAGAVISPYSVIGNNTLVDERAIIERAVVGSSCYIGSRTSLRACILGSRVTCRPHAEVEEGAVVGDRCHIDEAGRVRSGIKIWPEKVIEAGSTVTMSLIWGSKWQGSLFRNLGVAGLANVEMTPEFATKLGACYGSFLPPNSTVVTSRDQFPVSRMLKRAIISGLMSVGTNVVDLRNMPLPVARHAIRASNAAGGLHVRISPDNPAMALVQVLDSHGINISTKIERKIENLFFREDFGRCDYEHVGDMEFGSHAIMEYSEAFHSALGETRTPGDKPKIVIDYAFSRLSTVFTAMLGNLGWDTVSLNAYADVTRLPRDAGEKQGLLDNLSRVVVTLNADVGVLMDAEGEKLTLVDNWGRVVNDNTLTAVFASLFAASREGSIVAVPVTAPRAFEDTLSAAGGDILRTKTDIRALMAKAADGVVQLACDLRGGFICPEFHPSMDAMYAFVKLMGLVRKNGRSLAELADAMPQFSLANEDVYCPWEHKGRVMRVLAEEDGGPNADYTDGIKIVDGSSWALVLPDSSEPCFHIYAEATDEGNATDLVRRYTERVRRLAA